MLLEERKWVRMRISKLSWERGRMREWDKETGADAMSAVLYRIWLYNPKERRRWIKARDRFCWVDRHLNWRTRLNGRRGILRLQMKLYLAGYADSLKYREGKGLVGLGRWTGPVFANAHCTRPLLFVKKQLQSRNEVFDVLICFCCLSNF